MDQEISENSDQKNKIKASVIVNAPATLIKITSIIDSISIWSGKVVALMILPMVGSLVFEVICRYFFNAPTIWASDMGTMLYGAFFMLGSAYALQRQKHIRTDFLYEKWSTRTKGMVDSFLYITLYFPGMGMFMWISWGYALTSVGQLERIISSPWMPYIWPLKLTMPIAILMLLVQGISELLKSLYAARTGNDLHEDIESIET